MTLGQIDAHEDRLQLMEASQREMVSKVAEVQVEQRHTNEHLASIDQAIKAGLDGMRTEARLRDEKLFSRLDTVEKGVGGLDQRLKPLETAAEARRAASAGRKATAKQIAVGLSLTAAGGIVTKLVTALMAVWGH